MPLLILGIVVSQIASSQESVANGPIARPAKRHVAIVGDSYSQQLGGGKSLTAPVLGAANVALVNVLADQPWSVDPILDNFGVGGGTDAEIIARLPAIIARHPDFLFIQGGHNDFIKYGASRFSTMVNEWQSIISRLLTHGIQPVLILDPPINSSEGSNKVTLQQLRNLDVSFNAWKVSYAREKGLIFWDWYGSEVDTSDPNGSWKASYTDDGIHPNFAGNMASAQLALIQLSSIIGQPTASGVLVLTQNDAYDAVDEPYGNILSSALFLHGGGSASGGFRGSIPNGFATNSIVSASNKVCATSLVPADDGRGDWWQMSVSGAGSGGSKRDIIWGQNSSPAGMNLPAGTVIEGWVQIDVANNSPFNNCMGKLVAGPNVSLGNSLVSPGFHDGPGPNSSWKGTIYIPPLEIPSKNYSGITLYMQCQYNDAANDFSGTVRWRRPTIRIVQPPHWISRTN
jgi:lysophospholipase L1-like esterase